MFTLVMSLLMTVVDHHAQSDVEYEVLKNSLVEYFQKGHGCDENVQVVFVSTPLTVDDVGERNNTLEFVREYSNGHFLIVEGKASPLITHLVTDGLFNKDEMTAIVNPTNNRFSAKGGYINQLIHTAVGTELETTSKVLHLDESGVGFRAPLVFTIPLKDDNPLRLQEGYRAVIQVVSPNFNPQRAHCESSLEAVRAVLEESYRRILKEFDRLVCDMKRCDTKREMLRENDVSSVEPQQKRVKTNDYEISCNNNGSDQKHNLKVINTINTTNGVNEDTQRTPPLLPPHDSAKTAKTSINASKPPLSSSSSNNFGFNKNILFEYLRHPERHASSVLQQTNCCVVIRDAYPKARTHLLVLPCEGLLGEVREVRHLRPEHLDRLREVHAVARDIATKFQVNSTTSTSGGDKQTILIGYHAVPSLHPLHIHVISSDLDSPALKTKKHWNSFTLKEHFISIDTVEEWLAQGRSVDSQLQSERALHDLVANTPLRCNQCHAAMSNMPTLKKHLLTHLMLV